MFEDTTTRRVFLQKGLTMLAVGATVPTFLDQTVFAIANPLDVPLTQKPSGKDGKILVVVQLAGGNDGLNTVIPYGDDAYHSARRTLAVGGSEVLKVNDYLGLHPNLAPLKKIFDDGRMSIIQGVGYPNPNRSHFRSTDIWSSAYPEKEIVTSGWVGRYFDNACPGCDPHVGVSIGERMPLAMQGERVTPVSFETADAYRYAGPDRANYERLNLREQKPATQPAAEKRVIRAFGKKVDESVGTPLDFLHRTAMDAQLSSDDILAMTQRYTTTADYPRNKFGEGLRGVAAMIAGGLPTRVYYVSLGGFDTHQNQKGRHEQLMTQLAQGMSAFWSDITKQGNDQRVLMMTFSEFGRRVEQNASGGTDHGAAAPMFLVGGGIKEGIFGNHPSLTDLDQGDLKYNVDFRSVYATVLQAWLETPSKPILGQQFKLMPLVKA
ncbi:MAG: DUF1501 domain-containing protein [Tepidisphaeraceae bacterium]